MQLIQAQSIGFCFGVRRAIDMAEGILNERGTLYILGELIHNASVIQRLEALGAVTVNSIEEVPTGETVLIRSHGVPPKVIKDCAARSLNVKNATCPFVEKIHSIVSKQYSAGRTILIYYRLLFNLSIFSFIYNCLLSFSSFLNQNGVFL